MRLRYIQRVSIHRSYRYRLAPSAEQAALFEQFSGVCRLVYNLALEQRKTWWRNYHHTHGKHISAYSQSAELTKLREEFDWIAAVYRTCPEQALRDLDGSFTAFFSGRSNFPTFRKKGENDSFRFQGREITTRRLNRKWSAVRVPKIGWVKFRATRETLGALKNVTISHDAVGWHVSFTCEVECEPPTQAPDAVGIDRGVATTLALSTGELLNLPKSLSLLEAQKRKAQRIAARRKRGSNRRRRAQRRVARLQARQARIRRDFHHRAALNVAQRFGVVVLEDLKTRNMTASARGTINEPGRNVRQKAGLNRAILNAGWHQFQTILTYKMEERGGQVITVPAAFSSQTCSACGVVDARSRKNQAVFECVSCGHRDHADTNAALEILRRGSTSLLRVEGFGCGPVEARTMAVHEHGLNLARVG